MAIEFHRGEIEESIEEEASEEGDEQEAWVRGVLNAYELIYGF